MGRVHGDPKLESLRHNNTGEVRMKLFIFLTMIGLAFACESQTKRQLQLFGEGKDFREVFDQYATSAGYIDGEGMRRILYDAGVSWGCRWPYKVIAKLDMNGDGKLAFPEINSQIQNAQADTLDKAWNF